MKNETTSVTFFSIAYTMEIKLVATPMTVLTFLTNSSLNTQTEFKFYEKF